MISTKVITGRVANSLADRADLWAVSARYGLIDATTPMVSDAVVRISIPRRARPACYLVPAEQKGAKRRSSFLVQGNNRIREIGISHLHQFIADRFPCGATSANALSVESNYPQDVGASRKSPASLSRVVRGFDLDEIERRCGESVTHFGFIRTPLSYGAGMFRVARERDGAK